VSSSVKILIIRFSSIGDIVLTTPVIRCLKEQFNGGVEIHYITKKQYKTVVEHNPHLTKIHTIEKSTNEVAEELKALKFDYVIDLHKNLRSKRIIKTLKCISFSFDKVNYEKWLLTTFKVDKLPKVHIVDRYLDTVKHFDVKNDNKGLDYFISERDNVNLSELPATHQNGYVAFAIGAQHFTKRLPTHKIISICQKVKQPIILFGGKEDATTAVEIEKTVGATIFNACGKFSINQSASLVKQCKTLITHDTGLMHIGAALGVKIVSVWGNTVPAFGMYPYYPNSPEKYTIVENNNLSCRPCSKIGHDKCPKKHFKCMEEIDEDEVVKGLN
ncbi:MAG: glycosyltransferase family 9 protein, partial [Vicingaceae bacterium]|nr:glycosyltransferase family 9 protein [Vicingaceae bacterium]